MKVSICVNILSYKMYINNVSIHMWDVCIWIGFCGNRWGTGSVGPALGQAVGSRKQVEAQSPEQPQASTAAESNLYELTF